MRRDVTFYSDGIRLEGFVLTPDDESADKPRRTMLICSGLFGLKEWVPSRWWPRFLESGYTCMTFDYRGFGTSEGPRGRVDPEEQVRDVINAVTFLAEQPEVDPSAIGVMGWGLGGGVVVAAEARGRADRGRCHGQRPRRCRAGHARRHSLRRLARRAGAAGPVPGPARAHRRVAADPVRGDYASRGLDRHAEQFDKDLEELGQVPTAEFTLESAEAYYAFRPESEVASIAPRPLLIVHGTLNHYMPIDEARRIYTLAGEPKTLIEIPGAAHLEWISRNSEFYNPNVRKVVSWFAETLSRPETAPSAAIG